MYEILIASGKVERAAGLEIGPDEAFFLIVEDGVSDKEMGIKEMGIPLDREDSPQAGPSRLQILLLARRGSRAADVLATAAEQGWVVVVEARLLPPLLTEDECFFVAIPEQARVTRPANPILTKWRQACVS
jgi:putative heme iron utilization protein